MRAVADHLHPGEEVLTAAPGGLRLRTPGLLVASDRRLMFFYSAVGNYFLELPYEHIEGFELDGTSDVKLVLITADKTRRVSLDGPSATVMQQLLAKKVDVGAVSSARSRFGLRKRAGWPQPRWEWRGMLHANQAQALATAAAAMDAVGISHWSNPRGSCSTRRYR